VAAREGSFTARGAWRKIGEVVQEVLDKALPRYDVNRLV
jgi:hypothetical protein